MAYDLDELIAHHRSQCDRLVHGRCTTGRCLVRGGYSGPGTVTADVATCEAFETEAALRDLKASQN